MDKDWLENNLRNRFDGQEAPMDMEAEWAALQNRRKPKKSKRPFIWWLSGLGSLVVMALLIVWNLNFGDSFFDQDNTTSVIQENTENRIVPTALETITNTPKDEETSINTELVSPEKPTNSLNHQTTSTTIANKSILKKKKGSIGIKKLNNDETTNFENNKMAANSKFVKPNPRNLGVNEENKLNSLFIKNSKTDLSTKTEKRSTNVEKINIPVEKSIDFLETDISWNLLDYGFQTPTLKPWKEVPEIDDLPQYNTSKYKQGIGIHIGYGWNNRTLEAKNSDNQDFVNRRNDTELTLDVVHASLSYRRLINQKVYVEGHLGFQQAMDRLNDDYASTEAMFIENQAVVIRNLPDGTTETEMGTLEATVYNSVQSTFYQTYQQASSSIWIGFYDQTDADWIVSFAAGLDATLWSTAKGNIFQDANSVGTYDRLEDQSYKSRGVLSALMRLEGSRLIGETNEFGLGVQGKINMSDNYANPDFSERRQWITGSVFYRKWF